MVRTMLRMIMLLVAALLTAALFVGLGGSSVIAAQFDTARQPGDADVGESTPRQDDEPTNMPTPGDALAATATITPAAVLTATTAVTTTDTVTGATFVTETVAVTATQTLTPAVEVTATETVTTATPITGSQVSSGTEDRALDATYSDIVDGTIIANRTQADVRFFLEGETFLLDGERSIGVDLPRATGVLNLYNCDAATPETDVACYWDPYLLNRDGFYEIVAGAEEAAAVNLILREAGAPPSDQIWIQNRTGQRETVVYRTVTYELAPATVQEFSVADDALPTFFLRSCVEAAGESACEWAPKIAQAGFYYSLAEQKTAGGLADSSLTELTLEPVLAEASEAASAPVAESTPPQALCSLLVPALNVRSGPGLEYQIVAKVRGTADEPATVIVTGRNESSEWLAVTDRLADGGWITGSASYVACQGDLAALPVAEISDGRLAPTPEPVAQPEAEPADPAPAEEEAASETPSLAASRPTTPTDVLEAPAGQALLQVRNDFDHVIRFTIDQRFRPAQGPSEYDLEPGQAIQVAVWPGQVAFSVSTPWRGLSGNADMVLESGQTRDLKLTFVPDPEESGKWNLLVWE